MGNTPNLIFDVNRCVNDIHPTNYALRFNLTGISSNQFHALRLVTQTLGTSTFSTGYIHLNLSDPDDVTWTKLFTVAHLYGVSTVAYAQYFSGSPITSVDVGSMNGLTVPVLSGYNGFGVGEQSDVAVSYSYARNFLALVG